MFILEQSTFLFLKFYLLGKSTPNTEIDDFFLSYFTAILNYFHKTTEVVSKLHREYYTTTLDEPT